MSARDSFEVEFRPELVDFCNSAADNNFVFKRFGCNFVVVVLFCCRSSLVLPTSRISLN